MPDNGVPHVEVAGYAFGKLDEDETVSFEAHLAECAECRRELEELRGLPELLGRAAPPVRVPSELRARTLAAVRQAAEDAAVAGELPEQPPSRPALVPAPVEGAPAAAARRRPGQVSARLIALSRRPFLAAAVAAALVALLAIPASLVLNQPPTSTLAMAAPPGLSGTGTAKVTKTDGGRKFDVRMEGLRPPREGYLYELWVLGPHDTPEHADRVSLATFDVPDSGKARVVAFTAASASVYTKIGVTEEPQDGNPAKQGRAVLRPAP
jgi:Anti-sigma-K factor rskA, C-terminal/Putative zinc-finger